MLVLLLGSGGLGECDLPRSSYLPLYLGVVC